MILKTGVDIVKIERIKKIKNINQFVDKILGENELEKYNFLKNQNNSKQYSYLAKRFAGKEAFSKAIGTGLGTEFQFKNIEILNYPSGEPFIKFNKNILSENFQVSISLSDEKEYAVAFVTLLLS